MPTKFAIQHSEQNAIDSGNDLQPRASTPELVIKNDIKPTEIFEVTVTGNVQEPHLSNLIDGLKKKMKEEQKND